MSRVRTALALLCAVVIVAVVLLSGCSDASSGEDETTTPPARIDGLAGDDPVLVAREQLARDSDTPIEELVGRTTASAVDGEDVWLRVSVENPAIPGGEAESVYLTSENEGPWQVVAYGAEIEMGDLASLGASPATERALFYRESANEAVYDYLEEADDGRWADVHAVRQRFLNLGEDGLWALIDLAYSSSEDRIVLLAVLEWESDEGDWTVVAHGQNAFAVSEEPPEQLMSGPWTNDFRY